MEDVKEGLSMNKLRLAALYGTWTEERLDKKAHFLRLQYFDESQKPWFLVDKDDNIDIGVKSTVLLFKEDTPFWLSTCSVSMVTLLAIAGNKADQTWPYYVGLGGVATHLAWQLMIYRMRQKEGCLRLLEHDFCVGRNKDLWLIGAELQNSILIKTLDINSREDCLLKFKSNKFIGLILLSGIVIGNLVKDKRRDEINDASA
eukprot:gene20948-22998_t